MVEIQNYPFMTDIIFDFSIEIVQPCVICTQNIHPLNTYSLKTIIIGQKL